jgi:hypothetical protein
MPQAATKLEIEERAPAPSPFTELVLGAKLELYACLQLLAERARFLTGSSWSAIALQEGPKFVYRSVTGRGSPEPGTEAKVTPELSPLQPVIQPDGRSLIVAVVRDRKTAGFIQLVSESFDFDDSDIQSVSRLAEIIGIAIDHMHAAEHSQKLILAQAASLHSEELVLPDAEKTPKQSVPLFWHAPEDAQPVISRKSSAENTNVAVRLCESCGFPVSPGRKTCVDCEERGRTGSTPMLFSSEKPASWIRTHGYTIASLLLPALAAAIIYWSRLR